MNGSVVALLWYFWARLSRLEVDALKGHVISMICIGLQNIHVISVLPGNRLLLRCNRNCDSDEFIWCMMMYLIIRL